ncbi:hypothetical protein R1T40_00685 (plasmid) [Tritonibacter scottomollicae]|uniref:Plasmid recombination enzyme n=1 Tax=Tritonibacter scottomollicae TaxID=483013 RepID=A0ABZ0HAU0_TRISK|nr:hypothetical protein [Tritonibacter scottomollicae]WOI31447.1 hypothetical protein R1T40_00710 [Tritonibacter scottomollicae]WOI31452.1 hypothetical protein R1T40_00685 [Tritonibacter scottomollicae]
MFKAAIRVNKLTTIAQLRGAALHAQRHDETGKARVRKDAEPGFGLAWSKAENDRDYLAAFKAHKTELGAGERKGAPLCLQAICVVSPEWVEKAGSLHDPDNPRNRQLFDQAKAWAEGWGGKGSVIATRLDLDEKGGAVVDVLISPVRESRGKPVISTNKALRELKETTGERNEYSALQTSWADWSRKHLDPEIVRGTRKEITQRQHLSPETYGAVMDKARESVRAPSQGLWEAIRDTDLSERDTEALSDFLMLKGEIARHKDQGRSYEPPEGALELHRVGGDSQTDPWPLIRAVRSGAERVFEAAHGFGMGLQANMGDGYETGREFFPSLSDRMHLAAVVAKCGAFCARIEAAVKNMLRPDGIQIEDRMCWPQEAPEEVERHEMNLGLTAPAVRQEPSAERDTDFTDRSSEERDRGLSHGR